MEAAHARSRTLFGLPTCPPQAVDGTPCGLCAHRCRVPNGGVGYCGLPLGKRTEAVVSWYHDPLPTNCVADFVCPGGTGRGHPRYARVPGPEYGYLNLAVFYEVCSFGCLFCQNWHYRLETEKGEAVSPVALARAVIRRPKILILDEATSGVDSKTEAQIYERLQQLGATLIVVAHRLSTIYMADRIYLLEGGSLACQGTHEELLMRCHAYRALFEKQLMHEGKAAAEEGPVAEG
ncbi:MAG: hypothetical protein ACUVQS_01695 [Candidatus Bipolaricaulaceae bacterium]